MNPRSSPHATSREALRVWKSLTRKYDNEDDVLAITHRPHNVEKKSASSVLRDLEIRVARLERQSSPRVSFEREEETLRLNRKYNLKYIYIIAKNEADEEMGFVAAKLETIDYSRDCSDDLKALQSKYPQLQERKSLILYWSSVAKEYQGQGIGSKLYYESIKEGWRENKNKPFIFVPHYCKHNGSTSEEALRVWNSLVRKYPSSGHCIAILKKP
jgi:GNAT superfamily N-acetyltransferase